MVQRSKNIVEDAAPSVQRAEGKIKPSDLRKWDGSPLYVQNNSNMRIVHDDMRGGELTLGHFGSGEETSVLPLDVAKHPGFQRLWRRGVFTVSTDESLEDRLFLMEQRADELARQQADELTAQFESNPDDHNLIEDNCAHCGTRVFITDVQKKRGEVPPLCSEHEELEPLFNLEYFQGADGSQESRWVSTIMNAPTKEASRNAK